MQKLAIDFQPGHLMMTEHVFGTDEIRYGFFERYDSPIWPSSCFAGIEKTHPRILAKKFAGFSIICIKTRIDSARIRHTFKLDKKNR